MGDLSKNFSRFEFACRCGCGRAGIDWVTLRMLERMRHDLGDEIVTVTSAFRCPEHNRAVGGKTSSYHLTGQAVDFRHRILLAENVYQHLEKTYPQRYGLGLYVERNFVHMDSGPYIHNTRKTIRRWRGK